MRTPIYCAIMALSTKAVATPETINSAIGTACKVKEDMIMAVTVNGAIVGGTVADTADVAKEDMIMAVTVNNAVVEDMVTDTVDVAKEDTTMTGTVNNAIAGGMVTQTGQINTEVCHMLIDDLIDKLKKGELGMDLPVQRKPDQWNEKKQSDLITSVLLNYPIPSFCFADMDGKTMVVDGIQRITALKAFMDDDFCIHEDEELIITDDWGISHDISGKKYSELDHELQNKIRDYKLIVVEVSGADNDTVSDIFCRQNSGVPLSKPQTCRGALGIEMASYMDELCQRDYIAKEGKYTSTQQKIDAPLESLMQGAMLLDNCYEHSNIEIYNCKNISSAEVKEYCHFISKNYSDEQKEGLEDVLKYLEGMGMALESSLRFCL